jgi:hypothetical protein
MSNYSQIDEKNLDSYRISDSYTAGELAILKEKWKEEENRLNNADICGFNSDLDARNIFSKSPIIDLSQEQLEALQGAAKRYRYNQRLALEREAEKKSANRASVEIYADMIKVKVPTKNTIKGGGERKECKGFSDSSRRRLIQKMAQWNLNDLHAYFVTLTYPGVYASNWEVWKRDLDVLFKRLERKYPVLIGCCWRVEFQKRGAPHFHLIAVTSKPCKNLVLFRSRIAEMWCEIVADGYKMSGGDMVAYAPEKEKHLRAGTGVEAVQGRKQLMAYVSKYLAKVDQANAPDEWGRNWGFRNINGQLDFSPVEIVELDYSESGQLRRFVRRWLKSRGQVCYAGMVSRRVNYSVLGLGADSENGRVVYRILDGIRQGLFASHISPPDPLSIGCISGIPFLERLQRGLYDTKWALAEGDKVSTPLGRATVSQVRFCDILKRMRCAVYLDIPQKNGVCLAVFDLWQVKKFSDVEVAQTSLW